jgi:hypothetical protein
MEGASNSSSKPGRPAVTAWSRADPRRRWAAVALGVSIVGAGSCAETEVSPAAAVNSPRTAADDGDLWNLVPAGADALADVDLAALRASRWSSALVTGGFAADREQSRRAFGFDLFSEGDRVLIVSSETGAAPWRLTVVRGRFDGEHVGAAALASLPGAVAGRWRDSPIWEGNGRAVALVTPRTLAEGDSDSVRRAIDSAWGIVPDSATGPLGELRRAANADRSTPAVFVALTVTDAMRTRAGEVMEVPAGLRTGSLRLDLADDLNVDLTAILTDADAARSAAASLGVEVRDFAQQRMLRLLGLAPILEGLSFVAEGARVHGHLRVDAGRREALADKLHFVLQALVDARH